MVNKIKELLKKGLYGVTLLGLSLFLCWTIGVLIGLVCSGYKFTLGYF
mgnify:CR=1 FL=1